MFEQKSLLTFIEFCGKTADGHRLARFKCECGAETQVAYSRAKNGYTRSCGCLINAEGHGVKHGHKHSKTYASWSSAKDRTLNPKSKDFHRYGGVGIGFSGCWLIFENFLADMGERPEGTSLDRIDGTKGYEPGNCRWATATQQARNTKTFTVIQTPLGVMPIVDYAKKIGLTRGAAHLRMKRGKLEGCSYAATK